MRCRSDVSRAFAYFHFLERPVTKIGGAGDHCHPGAPSRMPSSRQLNGDCSISPRFHFRCRARSRSQIVPNGRPRLNAFMKGLAPRIRTNDRHVYCPRTSARCLHHPGGSGKKCPTSLGTNGSGCRQDAGPAQTRQTGPLRRANAPMADGTRSSAAVGCRRDRARAPERSQSSPAAARR
jgi:hypothetical protein